MNIDKLIYMLEEAKREIGGNLEVKISLAGNDIVDLNIDYVGRYDTDPYIVIQADRLTSDWKRLLINLVEWDATDHYLDEYGDN